MRVFITGDSQRPLIQQQGNIKWFYDLIKNRVKEVFKVDPKMLSTEKMVDMEKWIAMNSGDLESLKWYFDNIPEDGDVIVIGFELPFSLLDYYDARGIKYIDVIHYPIRFTEKMVLGVKSNFFPRINWLNGVDMINLAVEKSKQYQDVEYHIHPNSMLIIDQTKFDRSLISKGKMLSLKDYEDRLAKLMVDHDHVYYKPHPSVKEFENRPHGAYLITNDIYGILRSPNLKTVCSVSSNVIMENQYLGDAHGIRFNKDYFERVLGYYPVFEDEFLTKEVR